MNIQDLVKKSILSIRDRENTDFQSIGFKGQELKAKVEFGDFRKLGKISEEDIGNKIEDEISFLDVDTLSKVNRGDIIVYDSEIYSIEHFTKAVGLYKIFCTKQNRFGNNR